MALDIQSITLAGEKQSEEEYLAALEAARRADAARAHEASSRVQIPRMRAQAAGWAKEEAARREAAETAAPGETPPAQAQT